jgi:hypothetical protein
MSLGCPFCDTLNPDANRFCGNCGTSLDPGLQRVREELKRQISDQLTIATAQWKEQKTLDVETTEAIVTRIQNWAKVFGFFVAIPLVLIAVWLGLLGYRSYADFQTSLARSQADVDQKLRAAKQGVVALQQRASELADLQATIAKEQTEIGPKLRVVEQDVATLESRAGVLSKHLDAAALLAPKLETLSSRVDSLQADIAKFQSSSEMTPDRQRRIQESLKSFRLYLIALGINAGALIPTVNISTSRPDVTTFQPGTNIMDIGSNVADNPGKYLWAYAEGVLEASGSDLYLRTYLNIYFPDSFPGKPSSVNWQTGAKYDWQAVFWMIREEIGRDPADRLFATASKRPANYTSDLDRSLSDLIIKVADSFEGGAYSGPIKTLLAGHLPVVANKTPSKNGK